MTRRRTKYGNKRTTVGGITYDSKREAKRAGELELLQKAKAIGGLLRQVPFKLHTFSKEEQGMVVIGHYIADFTYWEYQDGGGEKYVVEDVKGMKTELYRWKARHMKAEYGIEIRET